MNTPLFYRHYAADPFFNMAFDEWLFGQAVSSPGSCYLRLYTWSEGTITFGYNQKQDQALDFSRLDSTPAIRRITGGRALYHDRAELTYAIAWNTADQSSSVLSGASAQAYRTIAEGLVDFLAGLGITSTYELQSSALNAHPRHFHRAPCFASHARYEITGAGRKIVASAARTYRRAVLQHGSIKVGGLVAHPALAVEAALGSSPAIHTASEFNSAADLFASAMGKKLGLDFAAGADSKPMNTALTERVKYVKKNCLERRLIFERKGLRDSLYRG